MQTFQSAADAVTLATAPDASCYLMPASATYPAIDSFKTLAILFRVQMSPREDTKHQPCWECLCSACCSSLLVWPSQLDLQVRWLRRFRPARPMTSIGRGCTSWSKPSIKTRWEQHFKVCGK